MGLTSILSVFLLRLWRGTFGGGGCKSCEGLFEPSWLGAGEPVPEGEFTLRCLMVLLSRLASTSSRHFRTISPASPATSLFLKPLSLLTVTPIRVERKTSSEGTTPFFKSFSMRLMTSGDALLLAAFKSSFDFSLMAFTSMSYLVGYVIDRVMKS